MSTRRVLAGRYEVGEVIGYGTTADVHRGHDIRSGRSVAALRSAARGSSTTALARAPSITTRP